MAGEIVRPSALPSNDTPNATDEVVSDDGVTVSSVTWAKGVAAGRPLASQAEAEAGTNTTKGMTPKTTSQYVAGQIGVSLASKAQGDKADTAVQPEDIGTAAAKDVDFFATAAQGALADSAVQPGDLATVATSGDYDDLTNKPLDTVFNTVANLIADETLTYSNVSEGDIIEAQGFRYEVAASDATDEHVATAGGLQLYILPTADGWRNVEAYGAKTDAGFDNTAIIQKCINTSLKVLIPDFYEIGSGLTAAMNFQTISGYGGGLKWMDDCDVDSRIETITIDGKDWVRIEGITIDGNKENQGNIPDTPSTSVSYGSALRVEDATYLTVKDVLVRELHGFGMLLYGSTECQIENFAVRNCGNKRAVSYSTDDLTTAGELYHNNNVGDGIYLSNSHRNSFRNIVVGHDADGIQDAASLRAAITFVNANDNLVERLTAFNICRVLHLEPNQSSETIRRNKVREVSVLDIGKVMTCVVLLETTSGQIEDNDVERMNCEADNVLVQGSRAVSIFGAMYAQRLRRGYKVNFYDCNFPEYTTMTNGNQSFKRCTLKGAQEVSPGGLTYEVIFEECDITEKLDLNIAGKALTLHRCKLFGSGHVVGGSSAINVKEQIIILDDNYFEMADADVNFFQTLRAPAQVRRNRFNYTGAASTGSWMRIVGRSSGANLPLRVDSNTFEAGSGSLASAITVPSTSSISYTTDGQNTVYAAFSSDFISSGSLANLTGTAPTKN